MPGDGVRAPLTVLHLSDLHASGVVSLDFIARAIDFALAAAKPDLICLTGDFITSTWEDWDGYARTLQPLAKTAPTFAVVGNHDGGDWVVKSYGYGDHALVDDMLAKAGIQLLHNRHTVFPARGWRMNVVGLGDWWAKDMEPTDAFSGMDTSLPTLLLSHNPDTKDRLAGFHWNLMLCGHTHGGQLLVPYIGTPFAPVRDHRYVEGMKPWENRWIHITRGVGNLHGMRLNCRPEVSVLTLV
jgi:hypothetical protein